MNRDAVLLPIWSKYFAIEDCRTVTETVQQRNEFGFCLDFWNNNKQQYDALTPLTQLTKEHTKSVVLLHF